MPYYNGNEISFDKYVMRNLTQMKSGGMRTGFSDTMSRTTSLIP